MLPAVADGSEFDGSRSVTLASYRFLTYRGSVENGCRGSHLREPSPPAYPWAMLNLPRSSPSWPTPRLLYPDVFLGDCSVLPPRHGYHPVAVWELAHHAGPRSCSETDRMGFDLEWNSAGGL